MTIHWKAVKQYFTEVLFCLFFDFPEFEILENWTIMVMELSRVKRYQDRITDCIFNLAWVVSPHTKQKLTHGFTWLGLNIVSHPMGHRRTGIDENDETILARRQVMIGWLLLTFLFPENQSMLIFTCFCQPLPLCIYLKRTYILSQLNGTHPLTHTYRAPLPYPSDPKTQKGLSCH